VVGITLKTVGSLRIEVNWCRLGEAPSSEPFVFWTYDDAVKFLKEEFEYLAYTNSKPHAETPHNILQFRTAITYLQLRRNLSEVEDCAFTIGEICYWLKGV